MRQFEEAGDTFGTLDLSRPELNLENKDIRENCLFSINQSYLSTVKNGEINLHHDNFILGQLIVAANQLAQIETYSCKENEVKLNTCLYDLTTGEFKGLQTELAFIMLRGDNNQSFISDGLILISPPFYILRQNKKFPMRLSAHHFENTILKLLMREERKRSFPLYFVIFHRSQVEKKQLIYVKIMSI